MYTNKLLKLNKMDGWNYAKPNRILSNKEKSAVIKYCKTNIREDETLDDVAINICELKHSLTFLRKLDFEKSMNKIYKKIGEFFLPYIWITVSPKKYEKKIDNFRIMILLDKCLREYFYQDFRKCDIVHWCLEFGSNGRHAHTHILCRPLEAQQKSFVKNFSRDFTTVWKKKNDYDARYIGILDLKKFAFKLNTLRRSEFIDDKLKYMDNAKKGTIHENPLDDELFEECKIKRYENC